MWMLPNGMTATGDVFTRIMSLDTCPLMRKCLTRRMSFDSFTIYPFAAILHWRFILLRNWELDTYNWLIIE